MILCLLLILHQTTGARGEGCLCICMLVFMCHCKKKKTLEFELSTSHAPPSPLFGISVVRRDRHAIKQEIPSNKACPSQGKYLEGGEAGRYG